MSGGPLYGGLRDTTDAVAQGVGVRSACGIVSQRRGRTNFTVRRLFLATPRRRRCGLRNRGLTSRIATGARAERWVDGWAVTVNVRRGGAIGRGRCRRRWFPTPENSVDFCADDGWWSAAGGHRVVSSGIAFYRGAGHTAVAYVFAARTVTDRTSCPWCRSIFVPAARQVLECRPFLVLLSLVPGAVAEIFSQNQSIREVSVARKLQSPPTSHRLDTHNGGFFKNFLPDRR